MTYEEEVEQLSRELTAHFQSVVCPKCGAEIGQPCKLEGGKYHIERGTGEEQP